MKVVRVNKRLIGALVATVFFVIFCSVSYFSSSSTSSLSTNSQRIAIRDVNSRNKIRNEAELRDQLQLRPESPRVETEPGIEVIHEQERKIEEKEEKEEEDALKEREKPPGSTNGNGNGNGNDHENDSRRDQIVKMMLHAWYGYKNHTWGANEIKPISKGINNQGIFGGSGMGATIVDAADTLWIMGLKEEYAQARDWIRDNFDIKSKATGSLSVFETTIRFLGGLLSLHALTGEEFYIKKAQDVGDTLLLAFKTPTGIPHSTLNAMSRKSENYGWASGGMSILAEIGTLHLEFSQLSKVTKQPIFAKKVQKVRDALDKAPKWEGLYPNYISPNNGRFSGNHISLGALGDSFYEYLIKGWIYSNYSDAQAKRMYWDVSEIIQQKMVSKSHSGLTYLVELRNGRSEHQMGHLACFSVGMFALEAHYENDTKRKEKVMSLAEELGSTCHESYIRSESRIGPEMFYFQGNEDATAKHSGANGYILRPEVIEGWFYLWRITGKQKYRDWVWDAMQAMEKWCRKEGGYAGLQNVYQPERGSDDVQQSFFLAETLKYAYLTFTDNSVMDLNKWVFNTEAHPLPIDTEYSPPDTRDI